MKPVAIFRHAPSEGPGYFASYLERRQLPWTLVALDEGRKVPRRARAYAGLVFMGGPMSANDALPWIAPLSALLRAAVDGEVPVIGHCLGGQLFAQALGAPVTRAKVAEIGWLDVEVCNVAAQSQWFGGRARFSTFQWHYDAFALPAGATPVLTGAFNENQGFVVDDRHIGLQCHVEMTRALTETWLASGSDELPASATRATQTASDIRRDLDARIDALHGVANDIYARWARGLR
jgi:GMP synthase-like glutamine amidotransferase